jgi:dolichyl-phosphate-mannose-protein mannosyltransferase
MARPTVRSTLSRKAVLLALFAGVSAVTRLAVIGVDVLNVDESSYIVGAWELLHRHMAYSSFADNKPPGIYLYYALTQLFSHGMLSVRLVTMLVTVPLTALAASAFYGHDRQGTVAGIAFLLFSAAYDAGEMLAVNCEIVMLLPLAWALVLVRKNEEIRPSRAFAAGVLIGIATLVKYQAVLWAPAVMVAIGVEFWSLNRKTTFLALTFFSAGVMIPLLATGGIFALLGGFEGFVYWNITHNIGYVLNPTSATAGIARGVRQLGPFVAVTAVLWFGWIRSTAAASRYRNVLIGGVIAASVFATCLGLRFFPHYFVQLYLPLAIGSAPWIAGVLAGPVRSDGLMAAGYSLAVLALFTTSNVMRYVMSTPSLNAVSARVASKLKRDPCYVNASMFVWGSAPIFYYQADLPPASRFFFPEFPLVSLYAGNRRATERHVRSRVRDRRGRHWRWLMADLRQSRPTYILDTAPAHLKMWESFPLRDYPQLEHFVNRRYDRLDTIDGVQIYRRGGCDGSIVARNTGSPTP